MMPKLLNGKALAKTIRHDLKKQIQHLDPKPGLAVLLVGNDPASHLYVQLKEKACKETGIYFEKFLYPAETQEDVLKQKIKELNNQESIDGILIQLPLPHQSADNIIATIDPKKDVDGFQPNNTEFYPPTILGILKLLEATKKDFSQKKAIIVSSALFARPLLKLLQKQQIQAEQISATDPFLFQKTKTADILITALGKPKLITADCVKKGAVVIDVGITRVEDNILGDVDQKSVFSFVSHLSPVPGGVGPMTVAMLLKNVLRAYLISKKITF